tara:strand:- start:697 stop:1227 length:531 start_codon:yes stop_codon:yes gene_type:complete
MNNKELNNLAQNRFTDKETQIAIAKHSYARCRMHLAYNREICDEAVEILLAGKSNVVKWALVEQGRLNATPERIAKVYDDTPNRFKNPWRMASTFGSRGWHGKPNTPPETLMKIYKDVLLGGTHPHSTYYARSIVEHDNCPEELAIIMSTSEDKNLQRAGFERLVAIKREKDRSAS